MGQIVLTKKGLEKLKIELEELESVRRPEVITRIARAKEYGDLSENAEYADARDEQAFVEGRIQELRAMLKYAVVADHHAGNGVVEVGSIVELEGGGEKITYEIVGANESDPAKGMISNESPLGRALLGTKPGDTVKVSTPDGELNYKVKSVK